jgi:hypothetical protein
MDLHVKMNFIYVKKRERSKFKKRFIEREREREREREGDHHIIEGGGFEESGAKGLVKGRGEPAKGHGYCHCHFWFLINECKAS